MQTTKLSVQEFVQWIALPENEDRLFELIDGEVVEVSPGRADNSGIPHLISFEVRLFCRQHDIPCYISGADGAFLIGGHVLVPDMGYKRTPLGSTYPDPVPPLWAVEVISPTDKAVDIGRKRHIYSEAGIALWEVYPSLRRVDIYLPGQPPHSVDSNGTLDAGDVLPGFTMPAATLFTP